jgi:hypothetical protein
MCPKYFRPHALSPNTYQTFQTLNARPSAIVVVPQSPGHHHRLPSLSTPSFQTAAPEHAAILDCSPGSRRHLDRGPRARCLDPTPRSCCLHRCQACTAHGSMPPSLTSSPRHPWEHAAILDLKPVPPVGAHHRCRPQAHALSVSVSLVRSLPLCLYELMLVNG